MSMIAKRGHNSPYYNRLTSRFDNFENFIESFMRTPFLDHLQVIDNHNTSQGPMSNIIETDGGYEIQIALPGLSRSDIDLDVSNGMLTVTSSDAYEKESDKNYSIKEFGFSSFKRSWSLPENIIHDNISAKFESGILNVVIPYIDRKENISRKIEIS